MSPVDIVDACLARTETLNQQLNAFITVLSDEAREHAKAAEAEIKAGKWRGPLHGVPVGVKDFYDTANVRTTAAFETFKNRVPRHDAAAVAKLKDAGAIVIGKTNMHRLGMGTTGLESYFGPVKNPWNDTLHSRGSSSGSAAAVAAGMCYATLDTDAIGSCRFAGCVLRRCRIQSDVRSDQQQEAFSKARKQTRRSCGCRIRESRRAARRTRRLS